MKTFALDDVELECEERGNGEPVALVHAGVFGDWFEPLLEEPSLTGRFRVVSYHRIGYAGSSRVKEPVSLVQQAAHLRSLMRELEIARAHIVGHSSGANIALQLALDSPHMVQSLALLEPALPVAPAGDQSRMLATRSGMTAVIEHYRAGNAAAAVDGFLRVVAGPAYREALDKALPRAFDHAVAAADTFFGQELPAVQQWTFTPDDARRVVQPVLAVIGERSPEVSPIWSERQRLLLTLLPGAEGFVLPGAAHLLHLENPRGMADALATFFSRHPIGRP